MLRRMIGLGLLSLTAAFGLALGSIVRPDLRGIALVLFIAATLLTFVGTIWELPPDGD